MPPTDLDGLLDALSSLSMRSEYKPGFRTGPSRHSGGGCGRGARFGGGRGARYSTVRRDGWGSSSTCAERHNVNRLPELDYFCRKLAAVLNDGECPRQWDLPYAKAGRQQHCRTPSLLRQPTWMPCSRRRRWSSRWVLGCEPQFAAL